MKYMIMTFGSAEEAMATQTTDWMRDMIAFMQGLHRDLTESGELIDAQGLVDGKNALITRWFDDGVVVTDGPYAESKESLVGYWLVEVASEARAVEIASSITAFVHAPIEVRRVADGPPEV